MRGTLPPGALYAEQFLALHLRAQKWLQLHTWDVKVFHHAILFDAASPAPVPSAGAARRASVGATPNRPLLVFGTASIYVFQLYSKNSTRAAPPIFGILEHWPPQLHGVSYSRKS